MVGLSKEFAARGHNVYITGRFSCDATTESESPDAITYVNIGTPDLKDARAYEIFSSLLYSRVVHGKILEIKPDVIALVERFSAYFPSKLDLPKTFTVHSPDAMEFYRHFALEYNRLNRVFFSVKRRVEEGVMANSDSVVALTKSIEDYLRSKGFSDTTVIPNAADPNEYSDQGDGDYILYAGRLNKVKGVSCLISAYSRICSSTHTRLMIVGSGPEETLLRELVRSEGIQERVDFRPTVNKILLKRLLSRCTVFVLPSLFEAFGVVAIEAMASCKPVVASDIPGPNEIITNGVNGFLFEKGNAVDLTSCLELCLSDSKLRRNIGRNARNTIEERYTFKDAADSYLQLWEKIR